MECITNYYLKRKSKEIEQMAGSREVKSRIKKTVKMLSRNEIEELSKELSNIDLSEEEKEKNTFEDEETNYGNDDIMFNSINNENSKMDELGEQKIQNENNDFMNVESSEHYELTDCGNEQSNSRLSISIIPKIDDNNQVRINANYNTDIEFGKENSQNERNYKEEQKPKSRKQNNSCKRKRKNEMKPRKMKRTLIQRMNKVTKKTK